MPTDVCPSTQCVPRTGSFHHIVRSATIGVPLVLRTARPNDVADEASAGFALSMCTVARLRGAIVRVNVIGVPSARSTADLHRRRRRLRD